MKKSIIVPALALLVRKSLAAVLAVAVFMPVIGMAMLAFTSSAHAEDQANLAQMKSQMEKARAAYKPVIFTPEAFKSLGLTEGCGELESHIAKCVPYFCFKKNDTFGIFYAEVSVKGVNKANQCVVMDEKLIRYFVPVGELPDFAKFYKNVEVIEEGIVSEPVGEDTVTFSDSGVETQEWWYVTDKSGKRLKTNAFGRTKTVVSVVAKVGEAACRYQVIQEGPSGTVNPDLDAFDKVLDESGAGYAALTIIKQIDMSATNPPICNEMKVDMQHRLMQRGLATPVEPEAIGE